MKKSLVELTLSPKSDFGVPVEAEIISPDVFAGKQISEIKSLNIWVGNRKTQLGEAFEIQSSKTDSEMTTIVLKGDLSRVRRIGKKMSDGCILIKGSAGFFLGEEMSGGSITVEGDAGSWAGSGMTGGRIEIKGDAGDYLTAGARGSCQGMKGGTIIIHGDAGAELGYWMENGVIKVKGSVGQFAGIHMKAGTMLIEGDAGDRVGAGMTGGKIIILGKMNVLPAFFIDGLKNTAKIKGEKLPGPFYLFSGDVTEGGKGKLFVSKENNAHLSKFERLIP
jgi:formylmethanofuran dehydrogenase subunit C